MRSCEAAGESCQDASGLGDHVHLVSHFLRALVVKKRKPQVWRIRNFSACLFLSLPQDDLFWCARMSFLIQNTLKMPDITLRRPPDPHRSQRLHHSIASMYQARGADEQAHRGEGSRSSIGTCFLLAGEPCMLIPSSRRKSTSTAPEHTMKSPTTRIKSWTSTRQSQARSLSRPKSI